MWTTYVYCRCTMQFHYGSAASGSCPVVTRCALLSVAAVYTVQTRVHLLVALADCPLAQYGNFLTAVALTKTTTSKVRSAYGSVKQKLPRIQTFFYCAVCPLIARMVIREQQQ